MFDFGKKPFWMFVLFVVLLLRPAGVSAQAKNISVTVYRIENPQMPKDKKPWGKLFVYGFFSAGKAERFVASCKEAEQKGMQYRMIGEDEYDVMAETDAEGYCTLQLPLSGYVVVKPEGAEMRKEAVKGRLNIDINIMDGKRLRGTTVTATRPPSPEPQIPNSCGNRLEFSYQFPLDREQVDVKTRLIVKPLVTVLETGDTLGYLPPFVKDGVEFSKANLRRMGFDQTRDPLYRYRVGVMEKSHSRDSIPICFVLHPIDKNFHYKVTADLVYGMNMKTPYRTDSVCLAEGYVRDPMRFLDYDMIEVPIDRKRYQRTRTAKFSKDHEKLNLNFLVGKAELDPADSANILQMERLKSKLMRYMSAESGITGAVIHGSASPEGGIALNERLCRSRAEYLRTSLISFPALQDARQSGEVKVTSKVASWEEVAGQLAADSLATEAEMVRAVLSFTKDSRRQEEQIRKLPCWNVIETRILPKFRYVDIEYYYFTNRAKTRDEIWKQYKEAPEYHKGNRQLAYEFYDLLDMLKDPVEKEPIAKAAYESVKEHDGERPWALAAYDLAQCCLARDYVDSTVSEMLEVYLDTAAFRRCYRKFDDREQEIGWFNDPAIVTTYINILCKKGDFAGAYWHAFKLLPEEPKYKRLQMFLRCLNCEWDVPEVMDTVANSSYWNKIVVLAAQKDRANKETALYMLDNASKVNPADPKVLYMRAQLLFNLYGKDDRSTEGYKDDRFMPDELFTPSSSDPYVDDLGDELFNWGLPMAQCCAADESFYDIMLYDGEFNEDYRKAFKAYWKKVKEGTLPRPVLPVPVVHEEQENASGEETDLLDEVFGIE